MKADSNHGIQKNFDCTVSGSLSYLHCWRYVILASEYYKNKDVQEISSSVYLKVIRKEVIIKNLESEKQTLWMKLLLKHVLTTFNKCKLKSG